jgi:hypothetical protein
MIKQIFCLLFYSVIFVLFTSFGTSKTEKPWIKVKEKDGIIVFLRDHDDSEIKEFKAQTIIKAPLKSILTLILDFRSYPKWVFSTKQTTLFENKNNREFIYYTIIKAPEPTTDRDVIISLKIIELTETHCLIKTSALPKYIAENPSYIRVKQYSGMWELTKINDKETFVITQCHTEPAGKVPAWAINYMITTGPFSTLSSMQNIFKEKKKTKK